MLRVLVKNTAWGVGGELAARLAKVVQVIVLIRWLGADQFGRYNHALAFASIFAVFFDFGVTTVAVREYAKAGQNRNVLLEYGALKVLVAALTWGALIWWTALFETDGRTRQLILLVTLYLWLVDLGTYVFVAYRGRQEFWRETVVRAVMALSQLAACLLALILLGSLVAVVVAMIVSAAICLVPVIRELRRDGCAQRVSVRALLTPLGECLPVIGAGVVATLYMNYDVVAMGSQVAMDAIGWYGAAVKTVFGILIMPVTYFSLASLPALSARVSGDKTAEARSIWLSNFSRTTLVGGGCALGILLFAKPFILLAFGHGFLPAAPIMVAFAWPCLCYYLYTPMAQWALVLGRQWWSFLVFALAALANVLLVGLWVPRFGVWGATYAALATHSLVFLGHIPVVWVGSGKVIGPAWWSALRVIGGVLAAMTIRHLFGAFPFLSGILAAGIFLLATHREARAFAVDAKTLFRRRPNVGQSQ